MSLSKAQTMLRLRLEVSDGIIIVATLCAATLFALEYDFFQNVHRMTSQERRISVEEFFALTGLLIVSLIGFSFWRLTQQKREFELRLAAEMAAREALHQAMHDPLTGLPNRRALLLAVDAALSDPSVVPQSHALLLLDLNGFKAVNDRHGHGVGDQLLQAVARRVRTRVGGATVAARLGGDEFAVFCPNIDHPDQAQRLADRLVERIGEPVELGGVEVRVGAGVGIAFHPQDAATLEELFRCADAALYRAKAAEHSRESAALAAERRVYRN